MRKSACREGAFARALKFIPLVWANLWRRPARTILACIAVTAAFALYGLALGEAEGFRQAAAARQVNIGQGFLLGAMAVSGVGMALILFLTNAMAQSARLRMTEFGILKAVGYSHRLILLLVTAEAALPCLAGAVAGLAVARLLFVALTALLPPLAVMLPPVYSPAMLGVAALLALLIGGVSGALPAARIVRLEVAAALAGGLRPTAAPRRDKGAVPRQSVIASETVAPAGSGLRPVAKADKHLLRQIAIMTWIGLATLRHRLKGALVVIVSLAVVTLAMGPGLIVASALQRGEEEQGRPDRAVVTSTGSRWDFNSDISADWIPTIKAAPGIARDARGAPLADAQTDLHCLGGLGHPRVGSGTCINLIGMEPAGRTMRMDITLVAGRWPRPGQRELMAGVRAAQTYDQLAVGKRLRVSGGWAWSKGVISGDWHVVGIFSTNSLFDADAIAPADMVRAAIGHGDASTIVVQLASPATFDGFRQAVAANPALHVTVERQTDYYRRLGRSLPQVAVMLEVLIGVLLGTGAMAGILHIMHITVESREGEIAVLRAIGFDGGAAAASVMLEAMLLALLGALLGIALLWAWLGGYPMAGVMPLSITLPLAAQAIAWAWGIAILGVATPALRAARMQVAEALRK